MMQKFRVYLKPKIKIFEFVCYGANCMAQDFTDLNVELIWQLLLKNKLVK